MFSNQTMHSFLKPMEMLFMSVEGLSKNFRGLHVLEANNVFTLKRCGNVKKCWMIIKELWRA
jgi:hypothetical protein